MKNTSKVAKDMINLYYKTAEKCIDEFGTEWCVADSDSIYYDNLFYNLRTVLFKNEIRTLEEKIEQARDFIEKMDDDRTEVQDITIEYHFKYICEWETLEIKDCVHYDDYAESILNESLYELSDEQVAKIFECDELIYFLYKYIKHDLELNEHNGCLDDFDSDLSTDERESLSMNLISGTIEKLDDLYSKLEK